MLEMSRFKEQILDALTTKVEAVPTPKSLSPTDMKEYGAKLSHVIFDVIYDELSRELGNFRLRLQHLEKQRPA